MSVDEPDGPGTLFAVATPQGGILRLERWPEGFVLWHHGEIVWRSWKTVPGAEPRQRYVE